MKRFLMSFVIRVILSVAGAQVTELLSTVSLRSIMGLENSSERYKQHVNGGGDFGCDSGARLVVDSPVCGDSSREGGEKKAIVARVRGDLPEECSFEWDWSTAYLQKSDVFEDRKGIMVFTTRYGEEDFASDGSYIDDAFVRAIPKGEGCNCESASEQVEIVPKNFNAHLVSDSFTGGKIDHGSNLRFEAIDQRRKEIPKKYFRFHWKMFLGNEEEPNKVGYDNTVGQIKIRHNNGMVKQKYCEKKDYFDRRFKLSMKNKVCGNRKIANIRKDINPGKLKESKPQSKLLSEDTNPYGKKKTIGEYILDPGQGASESYKIRRKETMSVAKTVSFEAGLQFGIKKIGGELKASISKTVKKENTTESSNTEKVNLHCSEKYDSPCHFKVYTRKKSVKRMYGFFCKNIYSNDVVFLCNGCKNEKVLVTQTGKIIQTEDVNH